MKLMIFVLCLIIANIAIAGSPRESWEKAMSLGLKDRPQEAIKILEALKKSKQSAIDKDELTMALARLKFQNQKFEGAIQLYSSIESDSDFWLQALEEKAWAYVRQNKYEKAIAQYHTLSTPAFSPQVGPEAYLIGSFSSLKICDYKTIFDVLKSFKEKYTPLIAELENLAKTGDSPAVQSAVKKMSQGKIAWADLGQDVKRLPQFLNRDIKLQKAIREKRMGDVKTRVKYLANADLQSLSKIVQKLHIIEVEAIQRMSVSSHNSPKLVRDDENANIEVLKFPKDDSEVWLDEVRYYEVRAKGCAPTPKGTSL